MILTLRITWSKLISFFFGLETGTSSLTVGLSNLFMKLSEILPGSNAVKPVKAMRGVRNVNKLDSECFACSSSFLHAGKCSIVHQIQGKVRRVLVMLPLDGHWVVVFNSILSILSIKCTLLSYLNMLRVYIVIIALWLRII